MKKRLVVLLAAVALALPLGANVATATPGETGPDRAGETGAACPENSPQSTGEDPSCGEEGKGEQAKADKGDNGKGPKADDGTGENGNDGQNGENGNNGQNGQNGQNGANGNNGQDGTNGHDGDTGDACPPTSPNAGGEPPCGDDGEAPVNECTDGDDNDQDGAIDGADTNDCQEGDTDENTPVEEEPVNTCTDGKDNDGDGAADVEDANDCQDGDTTEDTTVTAAECAALVEGPPPIVIEIPASPLLYACIILFPGDGDSASCPEGAVPVAVPAAPLADLCIVVGPEAPAA